MGRSSASFGRKKPQFRPQPRVLVLCEDAKSAKNYFEAASNHFRSFAKVQFAHCGRTDPLGIVTAAVELQRDFESVYCVIDRDSHENFDEALALAGVHSKVTVLTSYPCFEFWLLLHFGYTRAPYSSVGGVSAGSRVLADLCSKPGMSAYKKGSGEDSFHLLLPKLGTAEQNGERSLRDADLDGEKNPSTPLHNLIGLLRSLSNPPSARES